MKRKRKKGGGKERKKVLCSFSYLFPSILSFSSSRFTISLLFPLHFTFFLALSSLSSSFPLSLPHFPFLSKFHPKLFQGWATRPPRPPLVTPLKTHHQNTIAHNFPIIHLQYTTTCVSRNARFINDINAGWLWSMI